MLRGVPNRSGLMTSTVVDGVSIDGKGFQSSEERARNVRGVTGPWMMSR